MSDIEDPTKAPGADPELAIPLDPRLMLRERGVRGYWDVFLRRMKSGELGSVPVAVGLVVIWVVFQLLDSRFLSAENLSNLVQQMSAVGIISIGIVLVLLLGEIDLSVGSVSGLTSAILAVLNINHGWATVPAIAAAVLAGAVIGLLHGLFFAKVGVPAFVVTLAGLIGWQGLQLTVLGKDGTINFPFNGGVAKLANTYYTPEVGYGIVAIVIVIYVLAMLAGARRRASANLPARPLSETVLRAVLLAVALVVVVYVMNKARGLPLALVIFGGLVVLFDLILRRTLYGRYVFAVGGNPEAARRAGINVAMIRVTVFMLCSALAAAGGVMAASRLYAVNQSSGGSDVLLNAIAAAVIGGTSLFGGRGSTYSALLGILVIQSITNGMLLLNLGTDVRFMITGGVLLAAVTVDAVARRGRAASGRA
ncbi:MAG: D-xylose transport system permease protein [Thermoleophilaceae bacterium]|nr:D-xylose transport system permease protein [Thermoleophilaceae bacterium]